MSVTPPELEADTLPVDGLGRVAAGLATAAAALGDGAAAAGLVEGAALAALAAGAAVAALVASPAVTALVAGVPFAWAHALNITHKPVALAT